MEVRVLWQWHDGEGHEARYDRVTFKYDALGRRIEKCSEDKATYFGWDGNTFLHGYFLQDHRQMTYIVSLHWYPMIITCGSKGKSNGSTYNNSCSGCS